MMNANTLAEFERLEKAVMGEDDKQKRRTGLNNLRQRMMSSEPKLFEVAERCEGCGDVSRGLARYIVEAADYFGIYEDEDEEQRERREKECKEWRLSTIIRSKWRITNPDGVSTYMTDNYNAGDSVVFMESWVYMDDGYYYKWYHHREEYRLCRELMNAGYGDIPQSDREVIRLYCKDWEKVGLPAAFESRREERRLAEARAGAAAEELYLSVRAVNLYIRCHGEVENLDSELSLYDERPAAIQDGNNNGESNNAVEGVKPFVIDPRLQTDKAKTMFQRFADEGYIKMNEGKCWEWEKNKLLFAYFIEKANEYLEIATTDYKCETYYCRKPFEDLFGITKTSGKKPPKNNSQIKINNIFYSL